MNPGDFQNLNRPEGMPMFNCGAARWSGHEPNEFRPFDILDSVESNFDPNTQYGPNFTTDSYGLDGMEPSPASKSRMKMVKVKAKRLPRVVENDEYPPRRHNYTDEETILLTRCWMDISVNTVQTDNQRQVPYWERIAECYNELKLSSLYKCKKEQLHKHWDQCSLVDFP